MINAFLLLINIHAKRSKNRQEKAQSQEKSLDSQAKTSQATNGQEKASSQDVNQIAAGPSYAGRGFKNHRAGKTSAIRKEGQ